MQKYEELEIEYAKYIGTSYAVSTNTGMSALHLALLSIGIHKGDEVIVPLYTFAGCAFAVSYCGAIPVFVDCTDDLLIDVKKIKAKITSKTKAIMPVHLYGRICQMDEIIKIAKKYKLRIIEDVCEAQGSSYKGKMCGSFDIGVFSFYINKIIPAEEGGIITTNDLGVATRANYLKNLCFNREHNFIHNEIGYNYRMPNAEANYALANLRLVNQTQERRYRVESWYNKYIKDEYKMPLRSVCWVFDIKHQQKDKVVKLLNEKGIQARHGFKPMTMSKPYFNKNYTRTKAYKVSKEVMYLPVSPLMTEEMVVDICKLVNQGV